MKNLELNRIKEVGKKTITDFIRSEAGSVGVKNAATIGAFVGALALSQTSSFAWDPAAQQWVEVHIFIAI